MTIVRVVDAHAHLWDPVRADWYPYLAGMQELVLGPARDRALRQNRRANLRPLARINAESTPPCRPLHHMSG